MSRVIADRPHSIARSVVLHLLPGALITAFYVGVAPVVRGLGFPSLYGRLRFVGGQQGSETARSERGSGRE